MQPPLDEDAWVSPPFELTERNGLLYARGVSDDKGHIIARLAALDAVQAVLGELPGRVKFLVEGEEEISSVSLPDFVAANRARLAADGCIWEFGGVDHEDTPMQYLTVA